MSSTINHPQTDVVVLGLGHMGGPIAAELTAAGYQVVGIEKGPFWDYTYRLETRQQRRRMGHSGRKKV